MKRIIKAASGRAYAYPDVATELNELSYIIGQLQIEVDSMERQTESESFVERTFRSPEQAEAYVDAVKELEESMGEIYQRFMQISSISPDDKM